MFIIIVFRLGNVKLDCSLFHSLSPSDQSRDVTTRLGVSVILQCTSFRVCIFIPATIITTMQ